MTILEKIEARMGSGEPFTYQELAALNPAPLGKPASHNDPDRLADRTIQKWRRKGLIQFTRGGLGGRVVWTLVPQESGETTG